MWARFWAKTRKRKGCLIWVGAKTNGYGVFAAKGTKTMQAHRFLYLTVFGALPRGIDVMHSCDNRACVALQHLSPGSRKANMADAVAKGRTQRGVHRPMAKMTARKVRALRIRQAKGESYSSLARRYGITISVAYQIAKRRSWKHVK